MGRAQSAAHLSHVLLQLCLAPIGGGGRQREVRGRELRRGMFHVSCNRINKELMQRAEKLADKLQAAFLREKTDQVVKEHA